MVTKKDCIDTSIKFFIDNSGHRWRKSGQVKVYKSERNAHRFHQPIKHGLYAHSAIDETNCNQFKVDAKQY